ncbi:MAG: hypothetical protein KF751_18520 [Nitrospira sp.]|nr:hypothetical protein [Nitrospira sp.]
MISARVVLLLSVVLLPVGCGGEKHLPSSNPPEYDPTKVYTAPTSSVAKPLEQASSPVQLPPLEPGPNEMGEWKKVPVTPESLQLFNGIKSPCDALTKIVQGLGSAQLFTGKEGESFKQLLGPQAESVARSLDQQLFDNFKAQLGPTVADCPSPATGRKSSLSEPLHAPRRILTTGPSNSSFQLAQATPSGGEREGYTVTKGSVNIPIPPDAVGRKSREWRVEEGNSPGTAGDRKAFSLINGGYAKKCPSPDSGEEGAYAVEGDYEFTLVVDQTTNYSNGVRTEYNARSIHATLKGRVGDDAMLQYVDLDAILVIGRGGTNTPTRFAHQRQHVQFMPDRRMGGMPSRFSNWSVSEWDSALANTATGDAMSMLTLAVALFSGPIYLDAELQWTTPNTCVEILFNPATKTKKLGPNESVAVKTELRTKKEQALVSAKFKEAKERPTEGNGRVSPREDQSQPNKPVTFTYQAPTTRVKHSGFTVGAVSRAGVAAAKDREWEVVMDAAYVLEFQSRIISREPTEPVESVAAAKITLTSVEGKEDWYRGSGMLGYQTGPPPNRDPCSNLVMGHGTTRLDVAGISIKLSEGTDSASHQTGSADIELHYLIHPTNETIRPWAMVQHRCVPREPEPYPFFYPMYAVARGADEVNRLTGWTYVGQNGVVAKKVLRGNCGDHCEDQTVFTLREADDQNSPPK